jgi:antitoxin (DNA-binding transcriptional repressor) of toxin-antitoxin stability system
MVKSKQVVTAIDVRELEEHARDVLRRVKDGGEVFDVADGDAVIARIVPVAAPFDRKQLEEWWERHDELAEEISRHWPEGVSAADAIADVRREL